MLWRILINFFILYFNIVALMKLNLYFSVFKCKFYPMPVFQVTSIKIITAVFQVTSME